MLPTPPPHTHKRTLLKTLYHLAVRVVKTVANNSSSRVCWTCDGVLHEQCKGHGAQRDALSTGIHDDRPIVTLLHGYTERVVPYPPVTESSCSCTTYFYVRELCQQCFLFSYFAYSLLVLNAIYACWILFHVHVARKLLYRILLHGTCTDLDLSSGVNKKVIFEGEGNLSGGKLTRLRF